jgi:hypothetical protein
MGRIISKPNAPTPAPSNYLKPPAPAAAPVTVTPAPTTAEVSQATATEMDAKGLKRRRRGRSPTILTGAAGVQEAATLGIPTLLG